MKTSQGRLYILAAILLWSLSGLFAKAPLFDDWPQEVRGTLLAFWRAAFAAIALLPFIRRPRWKKTLVPLCISFTGMNTVYLSAIALTTAANAIWLQYTSPLWVFLFGYLYYKKIPLRRDWLTLGLVAIGLFLILAFESQGSQRLGVSLGLLAGFFYAGVIIFLHLLREENSAWLVALCHFVAALVLLPWIIAIGIVPTLPQLGVLFLFGAVQMALPYVLVSAGLRAVGEDEMSLLGLLEPILMPLWVFLVWKESPAWWTILGATLILLGLAMKYAGSMKNEEEKGVS